MVLLFLLAGQRVLGLPQAIALRTGEDLQTSPVLHSDLPKLAPTKASPIREISIPQNNSDPLALTVDGAGNLWFAETNPPAIVKYVPGSFSLFSIPTGKSCGLIWFLIMDNLSNLWFSCASEPLLWSFSTTSHEFSNFSTGNPRVAPYSLILDSRTNEIWFTSIFTDQIGAFQLSSGTAKLDRLVNVSGPPGVEPNRGLPRYGPSGITFDSAGNLFVTETFAGAIAEYSQNAQSVVKIWRLPGGTQPVGIAEAAGRIWFTNHGSSFIGFVNETSGRVTQFSTSLFSTGTGFEETLPYWIQLSPEGSVWFDEHIGNKIANFDATTHRLTEFFIPTPQSAPLRFALDGQRNELWFTEFQGNKLGYLLENGTRNCLAEISSNALTISGDASTHLTVNFQMDVNPGQLSISGTLSSTGALTSNLSISLKALNASTTEITLGRGQNTSAGNYTLTVCPGNTTLAVWVCPILFLTVIGPAFGPLPNEDYIFLGAGIIVAAAVVSLFYVRRWRRP